MDRDDSSARHGDRMIGSRPRSRCLAFAALVASLATTFACAGSAGTTSSVEPARHIEIRLAHGSSSESASKEQLESLLRRFDLDPWMFTSTVIIDVSQSAPVELRGRIPERSVVIPGTRTKKFPAGEYGVPCALIIGQRSAATDKKVSLNAALRDFGVPV